MTYSNSTTTRLKGHHLTAIERGKIAAWHSEGISNRQIANKMNQLPRKILSYATPQSCFEQELNKVVS